MTREEAIRAIGWMKCTTNREDDLEAIDMAIEALHREEAEEKGYCHRINYIPKPCENANCDCVAVVRCKDCLLAQDDTTHLYCSYFRHKVYEDDFFCAYGERREP